MRRLSTVAVVVGVLLVTTAPAQAATPRQRLRAWMNEARSGPDLLPAWRVQRYIAQPHSVRMRDADDLFHTARLGRRLTRLGIPWRYAGENVGQALRGHLYRLFRAFMASPLHRANILNPNYRRVGIGLARDDTFVWVTLVFWG